MPRKNKIPQLERISIYNMDWYVLHTLSKLAEKASCAKLYDLSDMDINLKLSVVILAENRIKILSKLSAKAGDPVFTWTVARSLVTAAFHILKNTDWTPENEATKAIFIIHPYIR